MVKPLEPETLARSGTEDGEQTALFAWAALPAVRDKYPSLRWAFAVPNGGLRDKRTANRLRATGLKPGVPDIYLPLRRGAWPGLWIELKRPASEGKRKGVVSDEQAEWINWLKGQGYAVMVAYGWIEARDTLIQYLEWKE